MGGETGNRKGQEEIPLPVSSSGFLKFLVSITYGEASIDRSRRTGETFADRGTFLIRCRIASHRSNASNITFQFNIHGKEPVLPLPPALHCTITAPQLHHNCIINLHISFEGKKETVIHCHLLLHVPEVYHLIGSIGENIGKHRKT